MDRYEAKVLLVIFGIIGCLAIACGYCLFSSDKKMDDVLILEGSLGFESFSLSFPSDWSNITVYLLNDNQYQIYVKYGYKYILDNNEFLFEFIEPSLDECTYYDKRNMKQYQDVISGDFLYDSMMYGHLDTIVIEENPYRICTATKIETSGYILVVVNNEIKVVKIKMRVYPYYNNRLWWVIVFKNDYVYNCIPFYDECETATYYENERDG